MTQGLSWGSLEYGGRFKIAHYAAKDWFAPVRVSCNLLTGNGEQISSGHIRSPGHDHTPKWVDPGSADSSPVANRTCTYQPNTDYGGDGRAVPNVNTKEACCSQCMADARCVVGVLAGKTCWFKYGSDKPRSKPGVVACKVRCQWLFLLRLSVLRVGNLSLCSSFLRTLSWKANTTRVPSLPAHIQWTGARRSVHHD